MAKSVNAAIDADRHPAKFTPRFGPKRREVETEILHESRIGLIVRRGDLVDFSVAGAWTDKTSTLAKKLHVNSLLLRPSCVLKGVKFLKRTPGLRSLSLSTPLEPWDPSPLEELTELEDLSISNGAICLPETSPGPLDFKRLPKLVTCSLGPIWPDWQSVFECRGLRGLYLEGASWPVSELDLSAMTGLTELVVAGMPKLTSLRLGDRTKIISLQLRSCRKLLPDWRRLGRDLQYLWIEKKPAYSFEELRHASWLKGMMLSYCGQIGSMEFVRNIPSLEWLDTFMTTLTPAGHAMVSHIKGVRPGGPPV
jgi:hypothetical protein